MKARLPELMATLGKNRKAHVKGKNAKNRQERDPRLDSLLAELVTIGKKAMLFHLRSLIHQRGEAGTYAMELLFEQRNQATTGPDPANSR